ncbi:MAG TPA: RidA family protein [Planctomycetes bacterium]|nr:RidA family protein [Planctomycetota bacterium]
MLVRSMIWLPVLLTLGCTAARRDFPSDNPELPFNKAVLVGDTLYVSGHLGIDAETGKPPADAAIEARMMLDAFAATMARANMTMDDLVQVQVSCSDLSLYKTFNDVYRQSFEETFPTRAFLAAPTLLKGCRYEIIGIAVQR